MTYFRLNPDCYWVMGKSGDVLYDVTRRRLFLLDDDAHEVLQHCESQQLLRDEWLKGEVHAFLTLLVREELGLYYTHPIYVDKLLLTSPFRGLGVLSQQPPYRAASWSITSRCDQDCQFCPHSPNENPCWQACRSCVRCGHPRDDTSLFRNAAQVVMRLAELGFVNLHIRGGNPFLEWERLLEILDSASRYPHLRVAVTTPGTGRSVDEITRLCKDYPNVRLNIVLFGWTENTGSHRLLLKELGDCQFSLLDTLRQGNAKFSIAVNFSDRVPADTDCVSKYTLDRWGTPAVFAEFYPWSRQVETDPAFHFLTVRNARKPLYLWRNPWEFFHRIQNNSCLYGAIEIAVDGSIRPCAGCLDDCGKISEGNISVPLADSIIYELWRTTKSDIETCRDCALRVACADCLSAERLGARNGKVAVGYCSVMNCGSLYKSANLLQPNDSVYLLSVHDGLELCPK